MPWERLLELSILGQSLNALTHSYQAAIEDCANKSDSKCQSENLKISLEEWDIINTLKKNPTLTQK